MEKYFCQSIEKKTNELQTIVNHKKTLNKLKQQQKNLLGASFNFADSVENSKTS